MIGSGARLCLHPNVITKSSVDKIKAKTYFYLPENICFFHVGLQKTGSIPLNIPSQKNPCDSGQTPLHAG